LAAPPVQLEIEPRITYGDPEQVGEVSWSLKKNSVEFEPQATKKNKKLGNHMKSFSFS